jgi:hypothetical protein
VVAALFHIAPFWRAELSTPPGWRFAENLTVSPDYMQYRVWQRQATVQGPLVDNRFTAEPNRPHLLVAFYWFVGTTARVIGTSPERVYAYLGIPLAFVLAILLYVAVRRFLASEGRAWWVFLATLVGGGLGAHLKILDEFPPLRQNGLWARIIGEGLRATPPFENYRNHYVVKTLLDTHFLLITIVALAAVLVFIEAVRRPSRGRTIAAGALFAAATLLHVYEGVTLIMIALAIAVCCRGATGARRAFVTTVAVSVIAAMASIALLTYWVARSGLPVTHWRAPPILFLSLVMAYPVAFALIAWGGRSLWQRGGFDERALFGWALGCTALTLSAPFFPYPDRGTMTLQVPLMILAGLIYFARWPQLTRRAGAIAVLVMGATPLWLVARTWKFSGFREDIPWIYLSDGHREITTALAARAREEDVLAADETDVLWLAPGYPGRHYAAHFFLTVNYDAKFGRLRQFFDDSLPDRRLAFLREGGIRWFFVPSSRRPESFAALPGVTPVARAAPGWLFAFNPNAPNGPR